MLPGMIAKLTKNQCDFVFSFRLSFLMIYLIGAEHVRKAEDWLREQVHWKRAHSAPSLSTTSIPVGSEIESDMLWTSAVVAYTIHKTILLPLRILLTGTWSFSIFNVMFYSLFALPLVSSMPNGRVHSPNTHLVNLYFCL
jgi:hypothetical protein